MGRMPPGLPERGTPQVRTGRGGDRCTGQAGGALMSLLCPVLNAKPIKEAAELISIYHKLDLELCGQFCVHYGNTDTINSQGKDFGPGPFRVSKGGGGVSE